MKQKLKLHEEAEALYARSLAVRRDLAEGDDEAAKLKQQAIAQSLVSLGNLEIERSDGAASDYEAVRGHYEAARGHMEAAKEAYIKGFHASHPKVAWALEGLGKIHEKCGDDKAALKCYREAAEIRKQLQSKDDSKEMFTKELAYLEERRLALHLRKVTKGARVGQFRKGIEAKKRASSLSSIVEAARTTAHEGGGGRGPGLGPLEA